MTEWLRIALEELSRGVAEIPDPLGENPRIIEYLARVGMAPDDEIPWCSAFANWVLEEAGAVGTGLATARSFLDWGLPDPGRLGAISILYRGRRDGWQGHVGFYLDEDSTSIYLLGGNQRDRVSIAAYPLERVLGHRWPTVEHR